MDTYGISQTLERIVKKHLIIVNTDNNAKTCLVIVNTDNNAKTRHHNQHFDEYYFFSLNHLHKVIHHHFRR